MKFEIEFHYPITYIPYRHQNTATNYALARTTVEVREIAAADAPVVMRVGNGPAAARANAQAKRFEFKQDGSPREIRFFEGRHFVEAGTVHDLKAGMTSDINKTFFGRAKPRNSSIDEGKSGIKPTTLEEIMRTEARRGPLRTFTDDKGEKVAKKLARLAELMFVIDGTVYEYTPEPILRFKNRYGESLGYISTRPDRRDFGRYRSDSFDFHQSDIWHDFRESLKNAACIAQVAGNLPMPHIEVLDPATSTYDGTSADVTHLARELANLMLSKVLGLPKDALEAYYGLRDALADADGRVTPRLLAAVGNVSELEEEANPGRIRSVAAYTQARLREQSQHGHLPQNIPTERAEFLEGEVLEKVRRKAGAVLGRWEMRPEGVHWENGVGPVSLMKDGGLKVFEVLSEGRVADYAYFAGADTSEVMARAARGERILASVRPFEETVAIASVGLDGDLTMLGTANSPSDARERFEAYLAATDSARHEEPEIMLSAEGSFQP